jgi:hypothetical protein
MKAGAAGGVLLLVYKIEVEILTKGYRDAMQSIRA